MPLFRFAVIFFLWVVAVVVSLYLANFVAGWWVPSWPVLGLHGVDPGLGRQGWGRVLDLEAGQGFNSWGQRDRERTVKPLSGVRRIAFVGDSFLEESAAIPLPLAVEKKLARQDWEVVNFGVSATGTSDYFYRIKNIVIPLGADEIFLFFYVGNDFSPDKLSTRLAIFSTYPKDSIASEMGLLALNHLVTNRHRNVLRVWQPGSRENLHEREQAMMHRLRTLDDAGVRRFLLDLSGFEGDRRERLRLVLARPESEYLFSALKTPDGGLFRSYMFEPLFHWAVGEAYREEKTLPEELIMGIYPRMRAMKQVCADHGIPFSVVLVPMGFHVDPRYGETWSIFGNPQEYGSNRRQALRVFMERLRGDGVPVHDLTTTLDGVRGTYLNVDGHWSPRGIDQVGDELVRILREKQER
ncbi:MAG: SGNH/GDSL hydrolase family protein [Magnetococcales bacterium]|nr:SGNH/GDSL hydrolase family protein [Magnetococcales bacterium]